MSVDRNAILDALEERLRDSLRDKASVTRRMFDPAPEQMPVLVVGAVTEQTNEEDSATKPGKWKLRVGCYLWVKDSGANGPNPPLMDLINVIEDGLKCQPDERGGWWTTLGGKVWHAGLVGVDTLPDEVSLEVGLAMLRIEVACKPVQ